MSPTLDRRAAPEQLRVLRRGGLLSEAGYRRALELLGETPPPAAWRRFLSDTLLSLGAALSLSGVIAAVAWNWNALGRSGRLGLVEGGVLVSALVAWRTDPEAPAGTIALLAASTLAGAGLAVCGQTYQTGAASWELFRTWALVILPWVLTGRLPALWCLELALVNIAGALWAQQVADPETLAPYTFIALALLNLGAWLGWERAAAGGERPWMRGRWLPRLALSSALLTLAGLGAIRAIEPELAPAGGLAAAGILAALIPALVALHTRGQRDLFPIAAALAAGLSVLDAWLIAWRFERPGPNLLDWLALCLGLLAQLALGLGLLRRLRARGLRR